MLSAAPLPDMKIWKMLLLYNDSFLFKDHSLVKSPKFFTTKDGREDPIAEWNAFIKIIKHQSSLEELDPEEDIRCRFPRRYQFAQKYLTSDFLAEKHCPRLEKYLKYLEAYQVSLGFSSQYLGNPASSFGHHFLILHREQESTTLDMVLGFSANAKYSNYLEYAYKGIFGGYPGSFSLAPYFTKIQEYNNYENRDLFEFPLNLNFAERQKLFLSLYELLAHELDYYFLDVNCSSVLVMLLESVLERKLMALKQVFVTPIYVNQELNKIGLSSTEFKIRYSQHRRFLASYGRLGSKSKSMVAAMLEQKSLQDLTRLDSKESAKVLDALIEYIDYKDRVVGAAESKNYATLRHAALIKRAAYPTLKPYEFKKQGSVQDAHGLKLIEFGIEQEQDDIANYLRIRPLMHEIGEYDWGLAKRTSLSFFDAALRFNPEARNREDRLAWSVNLFNLETYPGISRLNLPLSLSAKLGFGYEPIDSSLEQDAGWFNLGAGYTLASESAYLSLLMDMRMSKSMENNEQSISSGPSLQMGIKESKLYSLYVRYKPHWDLVTGKVHLLSLATAHVFLSRHNHLAVRYAVDSKIWSFRFGHFF